MRAFNLFRDCCNDLMVLVCRLITRRARARALFARLGVAKCGVRMSPTYRGSEIDVVLGGVLGGVFGSVLGDVRQFTEKYIIINITTTCNFIIIY